MKKLISYLAIVVIGLFVSPQMKDSHAHAQIRYYISKQCFDREGVQHSNNVKRYIAWTNGGQIMYECDANGNMLPNAVTYAYRGTKNGLMVYQYYRDDYMFLGPPRKTFDDRMTYYVSSDYSKLNWVNKTLGYTVVFKQSTPGSSDDIEMPETFY